MNILIISTQNPYKSSGTVAHNLYLGFKKSGHNTKALIMAYGEYPDENIISMKSKNDEKWDILKQRTKNKIEKINNRFKLFPGLKIKTAHDYHVQDVDQTTEYFKTSAILKKVNFKPDAIFYLFQQNFLTAKNLYELNQLTGAPIYWYLMDTAALTGACHYSWDCIRYTSGCGLCPALYSHKEKDQSSINFDYKYKYLTKTNIEIIAPTEWQYKKAVQSLLFKNKKIHKVLLSIDKDVYNYLPKDEGKKKLGLPINKKVIFFGSTSINDKRKGMSFLYEALSILYKNDPVIADNVVLLIAGNNDISDNNLPFEKRYLGYLNTNEQLADAYHAADIFLCPSIEDSGPMMINQAIMTGTPVVSFNIGVSEDLVLNGKTGYRANGKDSNDLAQGLHSVLSLSDDEHTAMCNNCRNLALSNYALDVSAQKLIDIIEK